MAPIRVSRHKRRVSGRVASVSRAELHPKPRVLMDTVCQPAPLARVSGACDGTVSFMTKLGDAIDVVSFNLRRPDRLCAALGALADLTPAALDEPSELWACESELRRVRRAVAMLSDERVAALARASGCGDCGSDDRLDRALSTLRAHERSLEACEARLLDDGADHGDATPLRPPARWHGFFASER